MLVDNLSASLLLIPLLYVRQKSKEDRAATHLWPVAASIAVIRTNVKVLLSVTSSNLEPYRYSVYFFVTAHFNTGNPYLCAGYFFSQLQNCWHTLPHDQSRFYLVQNCSQASCRGCICMRLERKSNNLQKPELKVQSADRWWCQTPLAALHLT